MFQIIQDIFYYELLMIGKDFIINVIKREFLRYDILVLSRIRIKMYKERNFQTTSQTNDKDDCIDRYKNRSDITPSGMMLDVCSIHLILLDCL